MNHGTFELTFFPAPAHAVDFPVTALYRPAPERNLATQRGGGMFRLDESLRRQLLDAELDHRGYASALGHAVFQGSVRGLFSIALTDTPAGEPLHVLLSLEAETLRELRWERLLGPFGVGDAEWDFLALNQRTTLAVYVAGATHQKFPPVGLGALKVLLVVASPTDAADAPPFAIDHTSDAVSRPLGDQVTILARGVAGASGLPTLEQVVTHLRQGGFTVLHIVAHGTYPRGAQDFCLVLEEVDGTPHRVSGQSLMEALRRLPGGKAPYLTFLSACESAWPGLAAHDRFADKLARDLAFPAVIGMADPVSVDSAGKIAAAFYRSLCACGRPNVALSEARTGLIRADDVLVPVLVSQLGARPLFDAEIDSPPADAEAVDRGLDRLGRELERRAPSLLGEFRRYRERPPRPDHRDWEAALAQLNNWADEAVGRSFNGLCAGMEPPRYKADVCPFNGMKAFDFDRRAFFKAREGVVETLAEKLKANRILAVIGPSGSGKSSVVFAGVLPALGLKADAFVSFAPGGEPLTRLSQALAGATIPGAPLVIDQFEELFTHQQTDEARAEFLDRVKAERERRWLVITLRSEFRERLRDSWLWELVADESGDIAPMPCDDLRRAMEEQAAEVDLQFEADLVSLIMDDVGDEPGRMPLLQHTLLELWNRRRGVWLKTAGYRELGGVHQALAKTAGDLVAGLSEADHRRVIDLFLRLTRVADESDMTNQTRRRARIVELVPAGEEEKATRDLLTRLVNGYLVVTSGTEAEVAHEALLRHWGMLGEWVRRHRKNLLLRQAVAAEAAAWDSSGRKLDCLMRRGTRLAEMAPLQGDPVLRLTATETKYLEGCASEERKRANFRLGLWIATIAAMILLVGLLALMLGVESQRRTIQVDLTNSETQRANEAEEARSKAMEELR
jgi:hypothetical protein